MAKYHPDVEIKKSPRNFVSIQSIWTSEYCQNIESSQQFENIYSVASTVCQCTAVMLVIQLFQREQQKVQKYQGLDCV